MKRLIILVALTLSLAACTIQSDTQTIESTTVLDETDARPIAVKESQQDEKLVMELYNDFLEGKINAGSMSINDITIPTGEPDKRYGTSYAYQDSNGDGVPELHINSGRYYTVLSCKNNELYVWANYLQNRFYTGLKDGAFMSFDSRIYGMYYRYFILNYSGQTMFEVCFSKESINGNSVLDQYIFDNVIVTKELWEELTERYLYVDADGIEQIRNKFEWTVLFEVTNKSNPEPQAIEGIPGYEDADHFPGDMVFAGQESIALLADIYREIGFEGEFQSGDKTVYDFYKQKFALLLEGRVKMYDLEGNESLLSDRYVPMIGYEEKNCEFYFFDMDEDGAPELCVQGIAGTYVCKYEAGLNRYIEWWGTTNSGCFILGTRRIADTRNGDTERLFQLTTDGYAERIITFNISYRPETKYLVSIPDFEKRMSDGQIPDSMKQQILYDEFWHIYYLRVTKEQYEELIKGLHEAEKIAEKERVPLSYFFDSEEIERR